MRNMTCRNESVFVAALCLGLMLPAARGGSLAPPAGPASSNSAMFTLNDIYNALDTRLTNATRRTGAFSEPAGGPTNGTMHTLNEIMALATSRTSVPKTGQTYSEAYGNDGWWSTNGVGMAFPNPRFTVLGNTNSPSDPLTNSVRDNLTGLIWARNANIASNSVFDGTAKDGRITWYNSINAITNMSTGLLNRVNYGGASDWRLPNWNELLSLMDIGYQNPALSAGHPFLNVQLNNYWASTTRADATTSAWVVDLRTSVVFDFGAIKTFDVVSGLGGIPVFMWPVRGGR